MRHYRKQTLKAFYSNPLRVKTRKRRKRKQKRQR